MRDTPRGTPSFWWMSAKTKKRRAPGTRATAERIFHRSAGWPVHVHHFNVGCGRIKLPEPIHDPPFMGVHLFEQYGLSDIGRADRRDHDELMRRAFAFAPIAVEDLDLHRLITNIVWSGGSAPQVIFPFKTSMRNRAMAFMYTLLFQAHCTAIDSPGLQRPSISRGFLVLMLTPALVQEEFRNECGHEVMKKPMNNATRTTKAVPFIQTPGQLVRRDAHLSFG